MEIRVFAVVLVLFCFIVNSLQIFVTLKIHGSPYCTSESLLVEWIFPESSACTTYPFGDNNVRYYYDSTSSLVNYTLHTYPNCTGETIYSYSVNKCQTINRGSNTWYVNFTTYEELPFDRNKSEKYFVANHFQSEECEIPIDGTVRKMYTTLIKRLDQDRFREFSQNNPPILDDDTMIYCSSDWIVEEVYNYDNFSERVGWKYFPHVQTSQCIYNYSDSVLNTGSEMYKSGYKSMKYQCLNQSEINRQYFDFMLQTKASGQFELLEFHYDKNCTKAFEITPWYTENCGFTRTPARDYQDGFLKITYYEPDCTGDVYQLRITKSYNGGPKYFGSCEFYDNDDFYPEFKNYLHRSMVSSIYFPEYIAKIQTDKADCDDPEALLAVKKDPVIQGDASISLFPDYISFLSDERCIKKNDKSFEGKCVAGSILYNEYSESQKCYGHFRISNEEWCAPTFGNYDGHYTCLHYFCGGYSEFDSDVCNGRGKCIAKDKCSCEEDYHGIDCESWSCNGVDKEDTEKTCNGRGKCIQPDFCSCFWNYSGKFCSADVVAIFVGVFFGIASPIVALLIFFLLLLLLLLSFVILIFLLCCFCFCSFCFCIFAVVIAALSYNYLIVKRRLNLFDELDDINILLEEQRLSRDDTLPRIKLDSKNLEIPYEDVNIKHQIGKGGSDAYVFLAEWKGREVAFKCFLTRSLGSGEKFREFEAEVNVLVTLNHPNIIRLFGVSIKPPRVGMVMEYCNNGELLDFVKNYRKKSKRGYPMKEKIRMCRELCSAFVYIHSKSILHRDLKPGNTLIDESETVKVMDFGISRIVESHDGTLTERIGTSVYMAPDIVKGGRYNDKCDVFSFAILLYVLFSELKQPYSKGIMAVELKVAHDPNFRPNLKRLFRVEKLPEKEQKLHEKYVWLKDIIKKCWDDRADERPSFLQLHELFRKKWVSFEERNSRRGSVVYIPPSHLRMDLEKSLVKVEKLKERLRELTVHKSEPGSVGNIERKVKKKEEQNEGEGSKSSDEEEKVDKDDESKEKSLSSDEEKEKDDNDEEQKEKSSSSDESEEESIKKSESSDTEEKEEEKEEEESESESEKEEEEFIEEKSSTSSDDE